MKTFFLSGTRDATRQYFADSALEGITRESAMTIAKDLGYEVIERHIARTELYMADEIFLTGSCGRDSSSEII